MSQNQEAQERQKLPSSPSLETTALIKLSMVATPIGHLKDITERAVEVLKDADEIWCEDTRVTQALLHALRKKSLPAEGSCCSKKTQHWVRMDQHQSQDKIIYELQRVIKKVSDQHLNEYKIAMTSDAGTPGVSDPGGWVVRTIYEKFPNIKVEPIPGASSFTSLLSVGGIPDPKVAFLGFLPKESHEKLFQHLKGKIMEFRAVELNCFVFFESPHRIAKTLLVLQKILESIPHVELCMAKELTKIHEKIYGLLRPHEIKNILEQNFDPRGEWVGLLSWSNDLEVQKLTVENTSQNYELALELLLEAGISVSESAQIIAQRFSIAKNLAYQKALELQKKLKK